MNIPERVEEIADAIDRTYEDERDRFDRGFRKQMTENTLTTLLTETDQQAREEATERCAVEVWNLWAEYNDRLESNPVTNALSMAIKRIRALSNPPSQV